MCEVTSTKPAETLHASKTFVRSYTYNYDEYESYRSDVSEATIEVAYSINNLTNVPAELNLYFPVASSTM